MATTAARRSASHACRSIPPLNSAALGFFAEGELPGPAEFLPGPAGVPDLGHVADLAVLELHHVDVVAAGALAGGRHRAARAAVGAREHRVGADVGALLVGGEGPDGVAAVRDEPEQPLHPLGVLPESAQAGQRCGLGGEARAGLAAGAARSPALARLAGAGKRPGPSG